jgi:TatD DNase family protein
MTAAASAIAVDLHCHLDLYPDHAAAISRAETARVYTLSVTTTPKAWSRNQALTRDTHFVRAALGLHPQLVAERAAEITLWEKHLPETRYVGEVGLDAGPRFYKSLDAQKQVFRTVLERCAQAGGKILTVHSVRSATAVLDMIETHLPSERGKIVLHWFTGSLSEARRAVVLGCYFSVNVEMARTERGRVLLAALPSDRLLTETDGPFTQINGRPAEPANVVAAVEALASVRAMDAEIITHIVLANFRSLLL